MTEIVDDWPELDVPYDKYCVVVTYPADAKHRYAGLTVRLRGDTTKALTEKRRDRHLGNGATSAAIMRQTWTPSEWKDA